jgi:predicted Zn-dependent protease
MKFWTSLVLGISAVVLSLSTAFEFNLPQPEQMLKGIAFVTQSNGARPTPDYETNFGDNWQSVRTFRLLSPLDRPLKVYVERNPKNPNLYQEHYRNYVVDGMNQWADALGNRLHYTLTTRAKDADITVDWVPSFSDRYVAGLTTYSVGHATVEIKTVDVPDKDIKCNIIHELGHALGISGHSNNAGDVMVGMRKWHRDNAAYDPKLSTRDVQAIRRLYSYKWQRGEDLFSVDAQRTPVLASSLPVPGVKPAEQVKQALNTEVSAMATRTASSQSVHSAPVQTTPATLQKQPRYTQIFPKP